MNKISSFAHFTSLSKRPISSAKSFKYPTSIPSPKNTSRKISNNIQSPTKDDELILIKRKFLNKSKHVKSTSTYLSFASPNNYIYLNKQNKLNSTIKSQLILTSMDNSSILHSKDKIFSYLNNSNYYSNNKNNSINRSLNNKSISICVRKKKIIIIVILIVMEILFLILQIKKNNLPLLQLVVEKILLIKI